MMRTKGIENTKRFLQARPLLAPLYGPAVRCKLDLDLKMIGLALLYPALERRVCAPGHHGYPRTSDLIL